MRGGGGPAKPRQCPVPGTGLAAQREAAGGPGPASLPRKAGPSSGAHRRCRLALSGPRQRRGEGSDRNRRPTSGKRRVEGGAAAAPRPASRSAALARLLSLRTASSRAARKSPPRPHRPAACRTRAARPLTAGLGRAGPGAWAYSFSSAQRPPTVSGDRRASPAPRTHQVAAGARHGPRPAGRRGPRSSRPLRAQRTAAQPEPMGLSHPLSVTSPTTMPPPLWAELPSNPQIHWSCYLPLTRKPARSASHQPQRTVSVSMRSCCGVAAGFTSCRGEGGTVRALSSFRLALTSGFSPCGRDAVGAAAMTSGGRVVPTPLHVVTARGADCSPGSSWCPIP